MKYTTLRCGVLPGESRSVVERNHEPLRQHLERSLGIPVELSVGSNYVATGEALRRGHLDVAYLGPVTYIMQSRHAALEPFARPTHGGSIGPTFQAAIIVPEFSTARILRDLRGSKIAMGDLMSTSGTWVPRHMLQNAGLAQDRGYTRQQLGAHDAVARAVATGSVSAGGISLTVLDRLVAEGSLNPASIRILAKSAPIPEYMWTFREGLTTDIKEAIRQAFLGLKDMEPLSCYRAQSFIPAVDADVDRVRIWMEQLLQARLMPSAFEVSPHPGIGVRLSTADTMAVHP